MVCLETFVANATKIQRKMHIIMYIIFSTTHLGIIHVAENIGVFTFHSCWMIYLMLEIIWKALKISR